MNMKDFTHHIIPLKNKLFRFALRILGNIQEAEDVVQEVMIKTWEKNEELYQVKNIEAWCMRMTKNLSIDKTRSKHRRTENIDTQYNLNAAQITPSKQTELSDTFNTINQIINSLPERQKLIIQLRDIEEKSYLEIADILNVDVNVVKVNLFRARKKIREKLIKIQSYGL